MTPAPPTHHVPEELLVEYVAGSCSQPAALAVACHVSLCPACAVELRTLESLGGASLETTPPHAPAEGALNALLARLEDEPEPPSSSQEASAAARLVASLGVPRSLLPFFPTDVAPTWRRLVPGIRRVDLAVGPPSTVARLVSLRPGLEIPHHDHDGPEYTVIFSGALADDQGRFGRGDISLREPGGRHVQLVERGEPCVALVINEGPLRPLTLKGRVLNFLARG